MEEELINKKDIRKKRNILTLSILSTIIILLGSVYAFFTYFKSAEAFTLTSNNITASFTEGTNQIDFTNAYPISDEFALENLSKLDYIDFTVSGKAVNGREAISYEIFLTESNNNTLSNNYVKVYLTDNDNNLVVQPSIYGNLQTTTYTNEPTGKVILKNTLGGTFSKSYRLYVWLDKDYEQNTVSETFSFYVNLYAYNDLSENANNTLSSHIISQVSESYISEYSGTSNDTYDGSGNRTIYYFTGNNDATTTEAAKANSNVLFAGYCWQIVRTTDTGGVKLLYNGVAENNQCLQNRTAKTGINGAGNLTVSGLDTTSVYGTGFTYTSSGFTLTGVVSGKTWSTDYESLIGMYTCKGTNTTCTTLSHIGYYVNNSSARGATYTIGTVSDKYTIGRSPFNGPYESASLVGYMYNSVYPIKDGVKTGSYYGNDVTYANNTYTLTGVSSTTQDAPDATHHYVCDDANCTKVRYYISYYDNVYRYITLSGGEKIADALYKQLNYKQGGTTEDVNLNRYNSSMKAYLESWYAQNLNSYSSYIDRSTAYCNDRKVINVGSWSNNGVLTNWWTLQFNNFNAGRTDLSCPNEMDRFSAYNSKAKLSYPIGLITEPERALMNGAAGDGATDLNVWGLSPHNVGVNNARVWNVLASGAASINGYVDTAHGARPTVTLSQTASLSEGDGTYANPYVVGEKVTRTIS